MYSMDMPELLDYVQKLIFKAGFILILFYNNTIFDGAGRIRASAAEHPGSTGGFSGQQQYQQY